MTAGRAEIYLDHNSTTPLLDVARTAMLEAMEQAWANPSSVHAAGRRAWTRVEGLCQTLGQVADVDPRDTVLTASGTEANNLALHGACAVVTSRLEHPSAAGPSAGFRFPKAGGSTRKPWVGRWRNCPLARPWL